MRKWIQTGLAVLVIVASLAFTSIGIARAATGYQWNPKLPSGLSLFSMSGSGATAEPTEMAEPTETVESTETAEPKEMDDSQHKSSSFNSDEDSDSFEHDEDYGKMTGTPQPFDHHSGSGTDGGAD